MADDGKIRLFKFIQKIYQEIGIQPPKAHENRSGINTNKWFFIVGLGQLFVTSVAYLILDANSMLEYGRAFFSSITVLTSIILHSIMTWQMENILNYIGNCEQFIEKSE